MIKHKILKQKSVQKESEDSTPQGQSSSSANQASGSTPTTTTAQTTPDTVMDEPEDEPKRRRIEELIKQRDDDDTVQVLDLTRYRTWDKVKWDLSNRHHKNEIMQIITEVKPKFIIAKPSDQNNDAIHKLCEIQKDKGGHYVLIKDANSKAEAKTKLKDQKLISKRGKTQISIQTDSYCVINELIDLRQGGQIPLFNAIRKGIKEHAIADQNEEFELLSTAIREFHEDEECAWDDVKGVPLDPKAVKAARKEEMGYIRRMRVYDRIKRSKVLEAGHKIIKVRWIDTNKGDDINPNMRSRLVAKEFNFADKNRTDLFAATPPLEVLKSILSWVASNQEDDQDDPVCLLYVDVRRAYFHAKVKTETYVELPDEDKHQGEDVAGKLRLSLYGTREAASNWEEEYSEHLIKEGFIKGKANPCIFRHKDKNIKTVVHGDDFTAAAKLSQLEWMRDHLQSKYEIKWQILGPKEEHDKTIKVLNRTIRWTTQGITYEADQKHVKKIIQGLDLNSANGISTPFIKEEKDTGDQENKMLNKERGRTYRSVTASGNYLGHDRPDVQYAIKQCSKSMSNPTENSWESMKKVGRYFISNPRFTQLFKWQNEINAMRVQSDSDWAGDIQTRKSTSGGTIRLGAHLVKSWSKDQGSIATSSGEAELYAATKAASEALGLQSALKDFGIDIEIDLEIDAKATIGIVSRQGLGRLKHVEVHDLWIQEAIKRGRLKIKKIPRAINTADLLASPSKPEDIKKFMEELCFRVN